MNIKRTLLALLILLSATSCSHKRWSTLQSSSVKIAIEQAKDSGKLQGAVLASDAFFPMSDSVEYAAKNGIKAIIQPGGSIKDQESIDMADEYGVTMLFTNVRHFRH